MVWLRIVYYIIGRLERHTMAIKKQSEKERRSVRVEETATELIPYLREEDHGDQRSNHGDTAYDWLIVRGNRSD
jgi:hypothetical protein